MRIIHSWEEKLQSSGVESLIPRGMTRSLIVHMGSQVTQVVFLFLRLRMRRRFQGSDHSQQFT